MLSCENASRPHRETDPLGQSRQQPLLPPTPAWPQSAPRARGRQRLLHYVSVVWQRPQQARLILPARPGQARGGEGRSGGDDERHRARGLQEEGSERRSQCEFSELRVFRVLIKGTDHQGGPHKTRQPEADTKRNGTHS